MRKFMPALLLAVLLWSCKLMPKNKGAERLPAPGDKLFYGMMGKDSVFQYTLKNKSGTIVKILNYGGTLTNLFVPDKEGKPGDVILGFDSLAGYVQKNNPYIGALVGRYANRIAKAQFILDDNTYHLADNDHGNSLHGGLKGFDKVVWSVSGHNDSTLQLSYESKNGEEGYPGNLSAKVIYSLSQKNDLGIDYTATTDRATPINLTNHAYFNLSAGKDTTILDHVLMLNASQYTEVNDHLIPTGKLTETKGSPMDFTAPKKIGQEIDMVKGGYDHNWVLNKKDDSLLLAASLYHPASGRSLEVYTTQPGIQFYTGNFLDGILAGKNGQHYVRHAGLCLETQHFPDSPNQPSFPSSILKPGQVYHQVTLFKFSVR